MFDRKWYRKSIFEHIDLKFILTFCIFIVGFEIYRLLYFFSTGEIVGRLFSATLILLAIFFFISAILRKISEERIAFLLFGLAFLFEGIVKKFMGHMYIPASLIWICLEVMGTISFIIAYKKYKKEQDKS